MNEPNTDKQGSDAFEAWVTEYEDSLGFFDATEMDDMRAAYKAGQALNQPAASGGGALTGEDVREQIRDVMDELDLEDITRRTAIDKIAALFNEHTSDKDALIETLEAKLAVCEDVLQMEPEQRSSNPPPIESLMKRIEKQRSRAEGIKEALRACHHVLVMTNKHWAVWPQEGWDAFMVHVNAELKSSTSEDSEREPPKPLRKYMDTSGTKPPQKGE